MATSTEALPTSRAQTTPTSGPLAGNENERSIGQLVSDVTSDLSTLVKDEIELAKVEIKQDVAHAGKGAGMFAGAGVMAAYGFGILLIALSLVLALWLPVWAGFLIVAVVLFIVAAVLGLLGKKQVSQVKGKPERAIDNAQATVQAVKSAA